jgi:hypothetical protein
MSQETGPRWDIPGLPHRGWELLGVRDLEEAAHTCDVCRYYPIRYVHTIVHADWGATATVA